MRHFYQTLTKDQETTLSVVGDFVAVYASTGDIAVHIGNDTTITLQQGASYRHDQQFDQIRIVNQHNGSNAINLLLGFGDYEPPLKLGGATVSTQHKSGAGHLYKTLNIEGEIKLLDFDDDRLFVHIKNKTSGVLKIGGIDIYKTFIELEPNEVYEDKHAPALELWGKASGKICIYTKYKTQQTILSLDGLEFNNNPLTFNNEPITVRN